MSDRNRDILLLNDTFSERLRPGEVIGSRASDGTVRRGADVEGVLSADHQALRIEPLIKPGWARAGITYGPYERQNGLAFAAFVLNGHNTAQSGNLGQTFGARMKRWLLGSSSRHQSKMRIAVELVASLIRRAIRPRVRLQRQLKWWRALAASSVTTQKDNMAVGWFASECPHDPFADDDHAFAMTALGEENGELRAKSGPAMQPLVSGVQNLPIYYVVVLREEGAAYYVASLEDTPGFAEYPHLRPIAIDSHGSAKHVHAGLFQGVMGEVGFRSNTRLHGARVARLARFRRWYGSAHGADTLTGVGSVEGPAEVGGAWHGLTGNFTRGPAGVTPLGDSLALLRPGSPPGLIHLLSESHGDGGKAGIVWRALDKQNHWALSLDEVGCRVSLIENGAVIGIATDWDAKAGVGTRHALQVLDDGQSMRCFLDGRLLFGGPIADSRFAGQDGVGISAGGDVSLRSFEAHPRSIALPPALDLGAPWSRIGKTVIDQDGLTGRSGENLANSVVASSGKRWMRSLGEGVFHRSSHGAQVAASIARPNPGRTLYTIDWDRSDFTDLEVSITPPGTRIGEGHMGRGGLVCWQDAGNYLVVSVWLDDVFNGAASVSSFFRLGGHEEIYDAVWTNVGRRIQWGVPFDLRLRFDGMHYDVCVDGEPVLYRALSDVYEDARRLEIRRVGLAANWEWGDDTGSVFRDFVTRV